jgi:hypothetical protein
LNFLWGKGAVVDGDVVNKAIVVMNISRRDTAIAPM